MRDTKNGIVHALRFWLTQNCLSSFLRQVVSYVEPRSKRPTTAYVPDLPGRIATSETVQAAEQEIRDAIRFHIDGLEACGLPAPASAPFS